MDRTRLIPEEKKKNKSEIAGKKKKKKKKNGSRRFLWVGHKSLRMALVLLLHPRSLIRFRVNKFLSAEMKRPAEKSGRPKCTEKPVISVLASVY